MKPEQERRSSPAKNIDLWLIFGAMALSSLLAVLLYRYEKWFLDPQIRRQEPREAVAKIQSLKNETKRRYSGSLTYIDVNAGESIYLGDTLFVSESSQLELKLPTGATLRLGSMTLVLVDKENNQIKFIMNNGEINATLGKEEMMRFEVNEELVTIQGTKGSRFKIKMQELGNSRIEAQENPIKVSYQDQKFELDKNALDLNDSTMTPKTTPQAERQAPKALAKPVAVEPIVNEPVNPDDVPLDIPIPFPTVDQLFLVKKKASVIILPKRQCLSQCQLKLLKNGVEVGQWSFAANTPPLLKVPVTPQEQGIYVVQLSDGALPTAENPFEILPFSAANFEKAIKSGRSVELLD